MDYIDSLKNKNGEELSEITIKNYKSKINSLNRLEDDFVNKIINNNTITPLLKLVKQKYPENYYVYISIISRILNFNEIEIKDKKGKQKINKLIVEGNRDKIESIDLKIDNEELKVDFNEYKKRCMDMIDDGNIPLEIKIMYNLYLHHSLRDDYGKVLLTHEYLNDNTNFYNINTNTFHLNNYKTKLKYNSRIFTFPKYLQNLIKLHYENGSKYLVNGKDKLTLNFSRNSIKYFDKEFTINDIRKTKINSFENKSIKKKKQLANNMLHDYITQQHIYKRK